MKRLQGKTARHLYPIQKARTSKMPSRGQSRNLPDQITTKSGTRLWDPCCIPQLLPKGILMVIVPHFPLVAWSSIKSRFIAVLSPVWHRRLTLTAFIAAISLLQMMKDWHCSWMICMEGCSCCCPQTWATYQSAWCTTFLEPLARLNRRPGHHRQQPDTQRTGSHLWRHLLSWHMCLPKTRS